MELGLDDVCPEYCACFTGGDLDQRPELCDGELVVYVLTVVVALLIA